MKIIETKLQGAYILEPEVFGDHRGWFMETFSKEKMGPLSKIEFVQDNQSYTAKANTIRGLHCQTNPHSQSKLIRCTRGKIYDVIVDIRKGSPTYKQWLKVLLSEENKKQLFIPKGFLHGFLTITDDVEVQYKVDEYYDKSTDRSIRFDDPLFSVDWEIDNPILSIKDQDAPVFNKSDCNFTFGEEHD